MRTATCKDRDYFLQHYALDRQKLFQVHCGHCRKYPSKRKRPDTPACENFAAGIPDEEAFVSKEYLSKELLQYLLNLELLPKIENSAQ